MGVRRFEDLRVYGLAEKLADDVWEIVKGWDPFCRDTVGKQIVRAADSVAANIAEGCGRGTYKDNRRFIFNARGSLFETRHWLRRAYRRGLLDDTQTAQRKSLMDELAPTLNAYKRSISQRITK